MSRSKLKRAMLELLAALLDALFQTLLHHLITGRIRVNNPDFAEFSAAETG